MPENSTNRGYPLPVAGDDFGPQASVNALGVAVDADVQALADDVADASGIDDGAIGPAKLDRAYAESANTFVRIGEDAGANIVSSTSVAIGKEALKTQAAPNDVIAIGEHALEDGDAIAQGVIAIGGNAARTSSLGFGSVAVGYGAAEYAPDGVSGAIAVGRQAQSRTSGVMALAIGQNAQWRASGDRSVAVGSAAQNVTVLLDAGTEYTDLPLDTDYQYYITGTNLLINGAPVAEFFDFGAGTETSIVADAGTLKVIIYSWDDDADTSVSGLAGRTPARDYHTVVGAYAAAKHDGGIALGYNAYADTDRQVQVGTAVTLDGVAPPNALRVGVHDAVLTTDTPTNGEVLRFDGSAWVADGAATAAQGALADSAVQPGDLATVATTGAYGDLSGTPTLGTAAATDASAYATAAQGVKADAAAPAATLGNQITQAEWDGTGGWPVVVGGTVDFSGGAATFTSNGSAPSAPRIVSTQIASSAGQLWTAIATIANPSSVPVQLRLLGATLVTQIVEVAPGETREVMVTGVLPTSSTFVRIYVVAPNLPSGESFSVSTPALHRGAGGIAIRPGVSVPNTGIRDKPTNVAVTQVYNRSTSSWLDAGVSGSGVTFGTTAGTAAEGNDTRVVNAVQTSRQVATGSGLTGGGDLTADRTLAVDFTAVATAAQGAAADSAVQVVGSPSVGDVIEWDGTQWVPAAASTGLLPRSATITGTSAIMAQSGTVAVVYSATFGGARIMLQAQNSYVEFDVLLDAGTYSLTLVHPSNVNAGIATLTLDGSAFATIDTYAAATSQSDFTTVTGLAVSGGRHTLRVAADTKNASSSGYYVLINAIHLVRTGA